MRGRIVIDLSPLIVNKKGKSGDLGSRRFLSFFPKIKNQLRQLISERAGDQRCHRDSASFSRRWKLTRGGGGWWWLEAAVVLGGEHAAKTVAVCDSRLWQYAALRAEPV